MYVYVCTRRECMNGNNVRGKKKTIKLERSWLVVIVKATNAVTELEKY